MQPHIPTSSPRHLKATIHAEITDIAAELWNALAGDAPMLQHAFLAALENTGCVGSDTGWRPCHLALWDGDTLAAAMPLYLKRHSYGEYVFDWAWARAYAEHGLEYYPKLLSAIPFTPVPGNRLLARDDASRAALLDAAIELAQENDTSSFHLLFHPESDIDLIESRGLLLRQQVQFHWINQGWPDFDAFLAALQRDKRKKIRQERNKLTDIQIVRKRGDDISAADWAFFNRCYANTYHEHRSSPYLNEAFFQQLGEAMPQACLLIMAYRNGEPLACAFNLVGPDRLYGRYWGADWSAGGGGFVPGLHFELCYYQGIEFAIEQGIAVFEGGAQGEHKQARGFSPEMTYSAHWLAHPGFARAVGDYLDRESTAINEYNETLLAHEAFKATKNPDQ